MLKRLSALLPPLTPALSPRRGEEGDLCFWGRRNITRTRVSLRRVQLFPAVLDVRDGVELGVLQLAADLLGLADVDVLHDVARLRIDRDGAARAVGRFPVGQ